MNKIIITRPVPDMTGNPADEPVSREDFPFPDYLREFGRREEDYILTRLENGAPVWEPRYDRRKKALQKIEEAFAKAPKSEFDDMTDDKVMRIAVEEVRATREERDKDSLRRNPNAIQK